MKFATVTIARVYILEGHDQLNQVMDILHNEEKIAGVTVARAIEGIGSTGELHRSMLLDLSLDLPLIIEFYDEPAKVVKAIQAIQSKLDLEHIVSWPATVHIQPKS